MININAGVVTTDIQTRVPHEGLSVQDFTFLVISATGEYATRWSGWPPQKDSSVVCVFVASGNEASASVHFEIGCMSPAVPAG